MFARAQRCFPWGSPRVGVAISAYAPSAHAYTGPVLYYRRPGKAESAGRRQGCAEN